YGCHMEYGSAKGTVKMTMHISVEALEDVMKYYEIDTKTEAVNFALREMGRKKKMQEVFAAGMGFTSEELKASIDTAYVDMLEAESGGWVVREDRPEEPERRDDDGRAD
ncbi:MAG: type II toxin-antitoxin system VapB family antitoxin, partial [Verrucomicrobiota bacterium]